MAETGPPLSPRTFPDQSATTDDIERGAAMPGSRMVALFLRAREARADTQRPHGKASAGPNKARPRLLTLPEQIAEQLAQDIVSETLVPGQRLKEMELANQFGASRAPIREALRLLELRGLVQIAARRGVSVTQLSAAEVDDLYEIRASLLGLAARRVALTGDEEFLARAEARLQSLRQYASTPLYGKYFEATYELSNLIGPAAGSARLFSLIRSRSRSPAIPGCPCKGLIVASTPCKTGNVS